MNGPAVGGDVPETSEADRRLAMWAAQMVDRISAGEFVDLERLALEHPSGVDRVRRLMPAMAMMTRLRAPGSEKGGSSVGDFVAVSGVAPGGSLGDFRSLREIGRGGMGVVYDAVQVSLNRHVALKILPLFDAEDPRKLKRFQVEAHAAACLDHPHIVPVYLVGSEGHCHYYAMKLIEGRTLAELIAEVRRQAKAMSPGTSPASNERPSFRDCAELGLQAAQALHFAHEQGIIHRDVKPSNLLLDDSGWLWVSDFGLARIAGEADLTLSGAVLGTLRYMCPEQAFGPRLVVDHRGDVYSLGATLYELITLHPVFGGDDRLELLRKIADEQPRRPRSFDPAIPLDLETIVLKAMARKPDERYSTARELADDLGRFLQNRPILARPPSAIDRAAKWVQRHKPAVAAAAVVLLVAVVSMGGATLWRNGVLRRHNSELRSALERAEENESATRRLWYDSQMRLAQQAWSSGQVELAQEILEGLRPEPGRRDFRGFEWHYLRRTCHRDVSVLTDHESMSMILTPDGRTLISGDGYGSLVFWDLAAGRNRIRVQGHEREVSELLLSPDGRVLASRSTVEGNASEVKLWDPATARPLATIPRITGYVVALAFSPDGRVLVVMEHDLNGDLSKNKLVFWSLARGPEHPAPDVAPIICDTMAYSPDGRWVATGMAGGSTVTLRDAVTGQPLKALTKRSPGIGGLVFSHDGQTLAAHSKGITIWDTQSGRELGSLPHHLWGYHAFSLDGDRLAGATYARDGIDLIRDVKTSPRRVLLEGISGKELNIAFSPDGKMLAGGGIGLPATLWDTSSGRKLAEFPGKTGSVGLLVFAPGGESLVFNSEDGRIRSWHFVRKPEPVAQLAGHKKEVWGLVFTPDGKTLISSSDDHSIKLWDTRDGELLSTLKGHDALVTSVAISADGKLLASASFDKTVRLWDLPGGRPRAVLGGHTDRVRTLAFSPDGRHLASAGSDKTVRVWDVDRGEPILVFKRHTDTVRAVAFDPSGTLLVSSSDDRTIRGIDVGGGQETFSLPCPKHNSALAFSHDGSSLASGDDRGNLTIWDAATWSRRRSVKGSDPAIWGLSFSPDGRTLAAACGDAKVRLWDPITGQLLLVLDGHSQRVNAVAFCPDGWTLASAGHDGSIRLWRAEQP